MRDLEPNAAAEDQADLIEAGATALAEAHGDPCFRLLHELDQPARDRYRAEASVVIDAVRRTIEHTAQVRQCDSVYITARRTDRRCIQPASHRETSPLHYNRSGFAWSDDEVVIAVRVDSREQLARELHSLVLRWGGESRSRTWDDLDEPGRNYWRSEADDIMSSVAAER